MDTKEQKEMAEVVEKMNQELQEARGGKPVGKRMGLVWQTDNSVMVLDVENIELFYGDLTSVTIKAMVQDIIHNPLHIELHNLIADFTEERHEPIKYSPEDC